MLLYNYTCYPIFEVEQFKKLVGGFNPFEKYAQVKLDHFPKDRGENSKNVN